MSQPHHPHTGIFSLRTEHILIFWPPEQPRGPFSPKLLPPAWALPLPGGPAAPAASPLRGIPMQVFSSKHPFPTMYLIFKLLKSFCKEVG